MSKQLNPNLRKMLKAGHRRGCASKNFHDREKRHCSCGRDAAELELAIMEAADAVTDDFVRRSLAQMLWYLRNNAFVTDTVLMRDKIMQRHFNSWPEVQALAEAKDEK